MTTLWINTPQNIWKEKEERTKKKKKKKKEREETDKSTIVSCEFPKDFSNDFVSEFRVNPNTAKSSFWWRTSHPFLFLFSLSFFSFTFLLLFHFLLLLLFHFHFLLLLLFVYVFLFSLSLLCFFLLQLLLLKSMQTDANERFILWNACFTKLLILFFKQFEPNENQYLRFHIFDKNILTINIWKSFCDHSESLTGNVSHAFENSLKKQTKDKKQKQKNKTF